jgi:hypothetical protein
MSQSEINQKKLTVSNVLAEALLRPFQITILDPAILFVNGFLLIPTTTYCLLLIPTTAYQLITETDF